MDQLNRLTGPFGIRFDGAQFGKELSFLDVKIYLDENNSLQYRLHIKQIDSRRYLNTNSFHDPAVFKSVPLSQLVRVMNINSLEVTRHQDVTRLISDLRGSGYTDSQLTAATMKAQQRFDNADPRTTVEICEPILLTSMYFKESYKLKHLLHQLSEDIKIITIVGNLGFEL